MSGAWSAVSGHDVAVALAQDAVAWPAVLRPCVGSDVLAPDRGGVALAPHEPSARLCAQALRAAASAPVRAVHWFFHPDSTVIAESAHGPRQSVILVGRVPHVPGPGVSAGPTVDPGLLLLGTWAASAVCVRLADLVGSAQDVPALTDPAPTATAGATTNGGTSATAVLTRWALPAECPPLPARFVTDLRADRLERALITDLAAALARVQMSEVLA